jgi:hypothetical protein
MALDGVKSSKSLSVAVEHAAMKKHARGVAVDLDVSVTARAESVGKGVELDQRSAARRARRSPSEAVAASLGGGTSRPGCSHFARGSWLDS